MDLIHLDAAMVGGALLIVHRELWVIACWLRTKLPRKGDVILDCILFY